MNRKKRQKQSIVATDSPEKGEVDKATTSTPINKNETDGSLKDLKSKQICDDDSDEDIDCVHEESFLKLDREPNIGEYVLVQLNNDVKKKVYRIGQVTNKAKEGSKSTIYEIHFLKISSKLRETFYDPQSPDIHSFN